MSKSFFKPFSCVGVLYCLCEWNGISTMMMYMITILENSGSTVDPESAPIIVGSIRLFTAGNEYAKHSFINDPNVLFIQSLATLPIIVGKFKPKTLFITGQAITCLGFVAIGTYTLLSEYYPESQTLKDFGWITFAAIVAQIVMRSAGVLPMLHTLLNELYPTEIRTLSIGLTQSALLLSGFSCVKVFPQLIHLIGYPALCAIYTIIGVIIIIWAAITIPDNRGKSLVKVEEHQDKPAKDNLGFDSDNV